MEGYDSDDDLPRREAKPYFHGSKSKMKLEKSLFVQDEAHESDEDEIGFGARPKDDEGEGEDGEDLDQNLATLVDDAKMDDGVVNEESVLEKFR